MRASINKHARRKLSKMFSLPATTPPLPLMGPSTSNEASKNPTETFLIASSSSPKPNTHPALTPHPQEQRYSPSPPSLPPSLRALQRREEGKEEERGWLRAEGRRNRAWGSTGRGKMLPILRSISRMRAVSCCCCCSGGKYSEREKGG